jgi:hypothetical protein
MCCCGQARERRRCGRGEGQDAAGRRAGAHEGPTAAKSARWILTAGLSRMRPTRSRNSVWARRTGSATVPRQIRSWCAAASAARGTNSERRPRSSRAKPLSWTTPSHSSSWAPTSSRRSRTSTSRYELRPRLMRQRQPRHRFTVTLPCAAQVDASRVYARTRGGIALGQDEPGLESYMNVACEQPASRGLASSAASRGLSDRRRQCHSQARRLCIYDNTSNACCRWE